MSNIAALFCKSFRGDFGALEQLLQTFNRHNPDNLIMTVSIPSEDVGLFQRKFGREIENTRVVCDESYVNADLKKYSGWCSQQICKLMSWRAMSAQHYLVVDSDCYFVRDIRSIDIVPTSCKPFTACGSSLRTVLYEKNIALIKYLNNEVAADASWFPEAPIADVDHLDEYLNLLELDQNHVNALDRSGIPFKIFGRKRWLYFQPGQIFSRALLIRLDSYFNMHEITPADAIQICPWEYNWYGEYAAAKHYSNTEFRISPILHFQKDEDIEYARTCRITSAMIAQKFPIIQMAARHVAALRY